MKFEDIPQFPRTNWCVTVSFRDLLRFVQSYEDKYQLDLLPDFQRGHVWTEEQRIRYVEYMLRGGEGGNTLSFNCPGWQGPGVFGPYQILDGLQRLTSVMRFMRNDLRAFGRFYTEYSGQLRCYFNWRVFELPTRVDVLQYYLDMNAGGTAHSESEILRVRALLAKEVKLRSKG